MVFPCPSKAAGLTVPVYTLRVTATMPAEAVCDSLVFGLVRIGKLYNHRAPSPINEDCMIGLSIKLSTIDSLVFGVKRIGKWYDNHAPPPVTKNCMGLRSIKLSIDRIPCLWLVENQTFS